MAAAKKTAKRAAKKGSSIHRAAKRLSVRKSQYVVYTPTATSDRISDAVIAAAVQAVVKR